MLTEQDTTIARIRSSQLDCESMKAALKDAGIRYEDLYMTPRPGVWQIEVYGNARRISEAIDKSAKLTTVKFCQDELDGQAYAFVMVEFLER